MQAECELDIGYLRSDNGIGEVINLRGNHEISIDDTANVIAE